MKLIFFFATSLHCCFVNAQINKVDFPKLETKFIKMDHILSDSLGDYIIHTSNSNFSNKNLKIKDLKLPNGTIFYFKNESAVILNESASMPGDVQKHIACCWFFRDYYQVPVLIKTMTCLSVDNDHIIYKLSDKSSMGTYQVLNKNKIYKPAKCFEVVIRVPAYVTCKTCISTHCFAIVNIGGTFYSFPIAQPQQAPDNQGQLSMPCGNCPPTSCQQKAN